MSEYRMTNADRIRSMSDVELAMYLYENGCNEWLSPIDTLEWLQQPAKENKNGV